MSRVLILSPHPDDEAIGCGGTVRKHVTEGDSIQVLFLTSGERGGHGLSPKETVRVREEEARIASQILGIERTTFFREPDGALKATEDGAKRLREEIERWSPDLIYLPHEFEMHPDHRASVRLLRRAMRGIRSAPLTLMFEIWTPLQRMDKIIDISPYVDVKRSAIAAYRSQCAVMNLDEAILGLNRYRGEMHSWPGGDFAEVFAELQY